MLSSLTRRFYALERALNVSGGVIMLGMMLLVTADVTARYLFNSPLQGTMEVTEFLMVGMLYFTLSHTQSIKAHIRIDILLLRLRPGARLVLEPIVYFVGLALFVLILWQGTRSAVDALREGETTFGLIRFPTHPSKFALALGSLVFCLRLLTDTVEGVVKLLRRERQ